MIKQVRCEKKVDHQPSCQGVLSIHISDRMATSRQLLITVTHVSGRMSRLHADSTFKRKAVPDLFIQNQLTLIPESATIHTCQEVDISELITCTILRALGIARFRISKLSAGSHGSRCAHSTERRRGSEVTNAKNFGNIDG